MDVFHRFPYNTPTMKYTLSGLAAIGVMVATAIPALAATPQQILDKSMVSINPDQGSNITGQLSVDVKEKRWVKSTTKTPENGTMTVKFEQRTLPKEFGMQNSEGRLTITNAQISDTDQTVKLEQPIKAQWKMLLPTIYTRLEQVPDSIVGMLKTQDVDLTPYLGQWQRIDIPNKLMAAKDQASNPLQNATEDLNVLKQINDEHALIAGKTQKTWNNKQGQKMVRVVIAANKALLYKNYQKDLKVAYKIPDRSERNAQIKYLRDGYNKTAQDLAKIKATADINMNSENVETVNLSFVQNDLKNECTWNERRQREICRNVGRTYVTVDGSLTFLPENHTPIAAPDTYANLDAVNGFLNELTSSL